MQSKLDKPTKNSSKTKLGHMVSNKGNNQGEEIQRETTGIARLQNQNVQLANIARQIHESLIAEQEKNKSLYLQNQELLKKCKNIQSQVENQKTIVNDLNSSNSKLIEEKQNLSNKVDKLQQKNHQLQLQMNEKDQEHKQEKDRLKLQLESQMNEKDQEHKQEKDRLKLQLESQMNEKYQEHKQEKDRLKLQLESQMYRLKQSQITQIEILNNKIQLQRIKIVSLKEQLSQEQKKVEMNIQQSKQSTNLLNEKLKYQTLRVQKLQVELENGNIQHEKTRKDLKEQIEKDKRIQNAKFTELIKLNSNTLGQEKPRKKSKNL